MPQVEFHILSAVGDEARLRYACQLADSAVQQQRRVFICVDSAAAVQKLDELLWTFRDQAFIPHEIAATSPAPFSSDERIKVVIGTADCAPDLSGVRLINLSPTPPLHAAHTELILEVVDADAQRKQQARERFKQYREQDWPLNTVNA